MGALSYLFCGVLAVLGRILGQMLGARWSVRARLRELRFTVLMDAWRRLEHASVEPRPGDLRALQRALSDVQLMGTPAQVALAGSAARSLDHRPGAVPPVNELLDALRVELRAEMRLRPASPPLSTRDGADAIPMSSTGRDRRSTGGRIWTPRRPDAPCAASASQAS